jgi:hypothetical protein
VAPSAVVYDLHTGAQLSFREDFNLFSAFNGLTADFGTLQGERGIQLDPVTRTGWTYSPYGNQIQQFSYWTRTGAGPFGVILDLWPNRGHKSKIISRWGPDTGALPSG